MKIRFLALALMLNACEGGSPAAGETNPRKLTCNKENVFPDLAGPLHLRYISTQSIGLDAETGEQIYVYSNSCYVLNNETKAVLAVNADAGVTSEVCAVKYDVDGLNNPFAMFRFSVGEIVLINYEPDDVNAPHGSASMLFEDSECVLE